MRDTCSASKDFKESDINRKNIVHGSSLYTFLSGGSPKVVGYDRHFLYVYLSAAVLLFSSVIPKPCQSISSRSPVDMPIKGPLKIGICVPNTGWRLSRVMQGSDFSLQR